MPWMGIQAGWACSTPFYECACRQKLDTRGRNISLSCIWHTVEDLLWLRIRRTGTGGERNKNLQAQERSPISRCLMGSPPSDPKLNQQNVRPVRHSVSGSVDSALWMALEGSLTFPRLAQQASISEEKHQPPQVDQRGEWTTTVQ